MIQKHIIFFLSFLIYFLVGRVFAQSQKIDSLKAELQKSLPDTTRINTLNALASILSSSNPDTSIMLSSQALASSEKIKWKKGIAKSLGILGWFNYKKGNYPMALSYYNKALEIAKELGYKRGIANALESIGIVYSDQCDYPKALEYYFNALDMAKELGNKSIIANAFGTIGSVYLDRGDYPKTLENYFKAYEIAKELGDKSKLAKIFGNIGIVYKEQGDYHKALEHFFKALEIAKELGDKSGIAINLHNIGVVYMYQCNYPKALDHCFRAIEIGMVLDNKSIIANAFGNIGSVYYNQGDYPKALEHYFKALDIAKELGKKSGMVWHLRNIGSLYTDLKRYGEAEKYLHKAIALSDSIGLLNNFMQSESSIATLYSKAPIYATVEGRKRGTQNEVYALAVEHFEKYLQAKDTLFNDDKSKSMGKLEARHEFALMEIEREKQEKERQLAVALAVQHRDTVQYSIIYIVMATVVLISVLILFSSATLTTGAKFKIPWFGFLRLRSGQVAHQPEWLKTGSVFITLLMLFEFVLLLIDTGTDKIINGDPVSKLGINAVLAICFYFIQIYLLKILPTRSRAENFQPQQNSSSHTLFFLIFILVLPLLSAFVPSGQENFSRKDAKTQRHSFLASLRLSEKSISSPRIKIDSLSHQKYFSRKDAKTQRQQSVKEIPPPTHMSAAPPFTRGSNGAQTRNQQQETGKTDSLKSLLANYQNQITELRSKNKQKEVYETYQKFAVVKDSLQKLEQTQEFSKIEAKHALEIKKVQEKIRAEELAKVEKARKNKITNLKYSFITIIIILLFIGLVVGATRRAGKVLSERSRRIPHRVLEGGLFVSFLLLFEFLTVLADPFIEQYTGDAPAWKLGFNTVIAICIFPLHSFLEGRLRRKLFGVGE